MRKLEVTYPDGRSHPIIFDRLEALPQHLARLGFVPARCIVVTDSHVAELMLSPLGKTMEDSGWQVEVCSVEPGESSKSIAQLELLYDFALKRAIDRQVPVVALGGGVIGDLAGFCAATLLRGVPLVHVPTTLVSQVDSSIGGKTGINHQVGKNLIGAFYQPRMILTDTRLLQTLPEREWRSGLGEVVKHALIDGSDHTEHLAGIWKKLAERDQAVLDEMIIRSAGVKVSVVTADEREAGRRAVLNFGHTFGHAIERAAGYGTVTHGEAVAAGMAVALRISDERYPGDDRTDAWRLLKLLGWPSLDSLDIGEALRAVEFDKKRRAGVLRFVLLRRTGQPEISGDVTVDDIRRAWESLT